MLEPHTVWTLGPKGLGCHCWLPTFWAGHSQTPPPQPIFTSVGEQEHKGSEHFMCHGRR